MLTLLNIMASSSTHLPEVDKPDIAHIQAQIRYGRGDNFHDTQDRVESVKKEMLHTESLVKMETDNFEDFGTAFTEKFLTPTSVDDVGGFSEDGCAHICIECGKCFSSLLELQTHIIDHTTKLFCCEFCDASFSKADYLKAHTRTHTGDRPYICKECGSAFSASTNLAKHRRIHTGDRRFKCQFCGRAFVQSGHLKKHVRTRHSDGKVQPELLAANQAKQLGNSQSSGESSHDCKSEKNGHVCKECGAKFARAKNLRIHTLKHTGVKAHICNICGQAFAIATYLREHQRSHSTARPYICSVCNAAFKASTNLYKHMRIHTGEKRFRCNECGQAFTQSGNLKKHMSKHTTDKPFVCTVCNAAFGRDDYLRKHKKSHVGQSLFVCMQCGAGFNSAYGLKKHQQSHESQQSTTVEITDASKADGSPCVTE